MNKKNVKQFILFGASEVGIRTMHQLGKDSVYAFCDNYKAGQIIEGKPVIDVDSLEEKYRRGG